MEKTVANLRSFFVGRDDCYAIQTKKGYRLCTAPLTDKVLQAHLDGTITIGSYTADQDRRVRCVTWDVDSGEFADVYRLLGVMPKPTAVFSSGRKGWHVIQSFEDKVPMEVAYHYGLNVKRRAGLDCESFPKQAQLGDTEYGNLTKLPWGKHMATGVYSELIPGISTCLYATSPPPMLIANGTGFMNLKPQDTRNGGWLDNLFHNELDEFGGRNNGLNKFVFWLRQRDFPEGLVQANAEWVNNTVFDEPLDDDEMSLLLRPRGF